MSACLTPEQFQQLLDDQLTAADRSWVEEHVEQCPECQHVLEHLTALLDPHRDTPADALAARYRPLRWHAKGGLGEVFVAWDQELDREVALKEMQARPSQQPRHRERFLREAKITSRLEHPGIVPVYGLGEYADGRPYYAMRFIQGETLRDAADRLHQTAIPSKSNRAFRELLGQFVRICETMAYAHSEGVLHRDLKPENILLGAYGEVLIIDWGLAKSFPTQRTSGGREPPDGVPQQGAHAPRSPVDAGTQQGVAMGTPGYMSPEQAAGEWKQVGPASDIYSLGAILYAVLTGQPPLMPSSTGEAVEAVPAPRQVKTGIPVALEAVCLKAMRPQPQDRYTSADALAEDIKNWLADEPVSAYPEPWWERGRRWLNRHRTPVAASIAVVFMVLFGIAVGMLTTAGERLMVANDRERDVRAQEKEARRNLYLFSIPLAQKGWSDRRLDQVREILQKLQPRPDEDDYRGFEWYYLWRLCHLELHTLEGHTGTVHGVAYSPDSRRLASAGADQTVRIWDAETGKEIQCLRGHRSEVFSVAYSPDGRYLASAGADCLVKLWDAETGKEIRTLDGHTAEVTSVAFRPDGRQLASAGKEGIVKVWEVATGRELLYLSGHQEEVLSVAYSPDGRYLASASADRAVKVWDAETGKELLHLGAPNGVSYVVSSLSYSPDGRRLVAGRREGILQGWDMTTADAQVGAKQVFALPGPEDWINSVAYSPDGRQLATAALNGDILVREAKYLGRLFVLRGHRGAVTGIAFSPNGRQLASAGVDKTVKIWDTRNSGYFTLRGRIRGASLTVYSPDGRRLVATNVDGAVQVWDSMTGQVLLRLRGHTNHVTGAAFAPDGRRLATASEDKTVKIWNAATGELLLTLQHKEAVHGVAYSSDGRRLASAGHDGTVKVWDAATGQELLTLHGHRHEVSGVAYSPDGRSLASASMDGTVRVWDAATGAPALTLDAHRGGVRSLAYSPDGRLASAGRDQTMKIWNAATGKILQTLDGRNYEVRQMTFSPDGRRLASAGRRWDGGIVKIWETEKGQELCWINTIGQVTGVAFSPDGRCLATAGRDGLVQVWETTPPTPELRRQRRQVEAPANGT